MIGSVIQHFPFTSWLPSILLIKLNPFSENERRAQVMQQTESPSAFLGRGWREGSLQLKLIWPIEIRIGIRSICWIFEMLNHTFYLVFELNWIGICICVDNPTFCRSATALMEVERATPPGFEEEILKPPEVLFTINTINQNKKSHPLEPPIRCFLLYSWLSTNW